MKKQLEEIKKRYDELDDKIRKGRGSVTPAELTRLTEEKDRMYVEELTPITVEQLRAREEHNFEGLISPEHMIFTAGSSFEPLAFSIQFFKPKHIYFLQSKGSAANVEKIIQLMQLQESDYEKSPFIDEASAIDVYEEIENKFKAWGYGRKGKNQLSKQKIIIDFTGGTKVMSAAAAIAGAFIGTELVYIGGEYDNEKRKPATATEFAKRIKNPHEVFGTIQYDKALQLYHQNNFHGAFELLNGLIQKPLNHDTLRKCKIASELSYIYKSWDILDFKEANQIMIKFFNLLEIDKEAKKYLMESNHESNRVTEDNSNYKTLQDQKRILSKLAMVQDDLRDDRNEGKMFVILKTRPDICTYLMFTLYQNAFRCAKQQKYDTAVLLLYRVLEMIAQRRLAVHGLITKNANYGEVFSEEETRNMTEVFNEYGRKVMGKDKNGKEKWTTCNLPDNIALFHGFIILAYLKDSFYEEGEEETMVKELKKIQNCAVIRNQCMYTHGFKCIDENGYSNFKKDLVVFLKRYCEIEGETFEDLFRSTRFIAIE